MGFAYDKLIKHIICKSSTADENKLLYLKKKKKMSGGGVI